MKRIFVLFCFLVFGLPVTAQEGPTPEIAYGFIGRIPDSAPRVIGAEAEPERHEFATGDRLFINRGTKDGLVEGGAFAIVRDFGEIRHPKTKQPLGRMVLPVGRARVLAVKDGSAQIEITGSNREILNGDRLLPVNFASETPSTASAVPGVATVAPLVVVPQRPSAASAADLVFVVQPEAKFIAGQKVTFRHAVGAESVGRYVESQSGPRSPYFSGDSRLAPVQAPLLNSNPSLETLRREPARAELPPVVIGYGTVVAVYSNIAVVKVTAARQEITNRDVVVYEP